MGHGLQPFAMLVVSLPALLVWLGAAVVPLLLAWLSLRNPRLVRWAATEFITRAVRRQHFSRGGLPLPLTLLRIVLLTLAALAAARPLLETADLVSGRQPSAQRAPAAASTATRRIEIVAGDPDAPDRRQRGRDRDAGPDADGGSLAIGRAIEAVAETAPGRLAVTWCGLPAAGHGPPTPPTVIILCDGSVPLAGDAARIGRAVAAGAGLLVCVGPQSVAEGSRQRLSAWLDGLIGVRLDGRIDLDAATIEVAADLAADIGGPIRGPSVSAAADLGLPNTGEVTIVASTADGRPLIVTGSHGRGTVCVSALPLTLPQSGGADGWAAAWTDLAAWPVFVPLLDRLLDGLPAVERAGAGSAAGEPAPALPLAPPLLAVAAALALAEWWLAARAVAGLASGGGLSLLQHAGHVGIVAAIVGLLAGSSRGIPPSAAPTHAGAARRPVAVIIDASPSMGSRDGRGAVRAAPPVTRLESLRSGLLGQMAGTGPLDRIAREHPVVIFTVAGEIVRLGLYPREVTAADLQGVAAASSAVGASPLGDAILTALGGAVGGEETADAEPVAPAAIVIASDGLLAGGASWAAAARAAADRGVPVIAVPVGDAESAPPPDALPPGFRLVSVAAPRLCRESEPTIFDVQAEAATGAGPLPVAIFAAGDTRAEPLATGTLVVEPAAAAAAPSMLPRRFTGRLVVPPHSFRSGSGAVCSPWVCIGSVSDVGTVGNAAVVTTVPLVVTATPTRVLLIDAVPRYEWRFLEQLLSVTAGIEPETCLMTSGTTVGLRAGSPLPDTPAAWNRFDVVVLGDLPPADAAGSTPPVPAPAWEELRTAAVDRGLGIAWIPGPRWWEDRGSGIDWLPAQAVGPAAVPATLPAVLRATPGGRDSGWIAWAGEAKQPEVLALLRPVTLRPTARVLATAATAGAGGLDPERVPAVIIDRLGNGGIIGHLCETWRWRRGDPRRYEDYWRRAIGRLAEPHLIGRLFPATLGVRPAVIRAGDSVRIDVTPTWNTTDLAGWQLELSQRPGAAEGLGGADGRDQNGPQGDLPADARRWLPLPASGGPGRTATITLDRVAAGVHTIRLVPPASGIDGLPAARVEAEFVVAHPSVETPGGPALVGPLAAVARATGGGVVEIETLDDLPGAVSSAIAAAGRHDGRAGRRPSGEELLALPLTAHLVMAVLVAAAVLAWWVPRPRASPGETP